MEFTVVTAHIPCPSCVGIGAPIGEDKVTEWSRQCAQCHGTGRISVKFKRPVYVPQLEPVTSKPDIPKTCSECGKDFIAHNWSAKYCSPKCKNHPEIHKKECELCNKPYRTRHGESKYCSVDCRTASVKTGTIDMVCAACDKSFKGKVPWQLCCSSICRKALKRERYHLSRWKKLDDEINEIELLLASGKAHENYGTETRARTRLRSLLAKRNNRDRP